MAKLVQALWAEELDGVIGKDGTLPWHIPYDLQFFKEKTWDTTVIMGRKTFDGMNQKPLPHRKNIVLSRQHHQYDGAEVMHTIEEIAQYIEKTDAVVSIIGGVRVFEELFPYCDVIYRTIVEGHYDGDTYAPMIPFEKFAHAQSTYVPCGLKNNVPLIIEKWIKKEK